MNVEILYNYSELGKAYAHSNSSTSMLIGQRHVLLLTTIMALVLSAGCAGFSSASPDDVVVNNYLNKNVDVDIKITHAGTGDVVLEESVSIEPNGTAAFEDSVKSDNEYRLSISTSTGLSDQFEWREGGSDSVDAFIRQNEITFLHGTI